MSLSYPNLIWFKRDLRVHDQPALSAALKAGPSLAFYIFEPELWARHDATYRHYYFIAAALKELHHNLHSRGIPFLILKGDCCEKLSEMLKKYQSQCLFSCQETGNYWTYQRDLKVKDFCQKQGLVWYEYPQHGVIRCLKKRDGWAAKWAQFMNQDQLMIKQQGRPISTDFKLPSAKDLRLDIEVDHNFQLGGESKGQALLYSFLQKRGINYSKEMSSPVTAYESCSRLSTHLSYGTVSLRYCYQEAMARKNSFKGLSRQARGTWPFSIQSFLGRLRWHCHFMQKLEDEPEMEFRALHSAYRHLDNKDYNIEFFEKWKVGQSGFTLLDACMRALKKTGWLNFRMRAMIVSVACQHLQLPWLKVAHYLAGQFTDYEAGIHYSQCQMQAGVTGMNAIRIYNPIKQAYDHDPKGVFLKQWLPEYAHLEGVQLIEPSCHDWRIEAPLVDEKIARQKAAAILYGIRKNTVSEETQTLLKKHGSRRKIRPRQKKV